MKRILILLLTISIFGCTTETPQENSLLKFAPQDASVILRINDFDRFQSELKNNSLLQSFKNPKFKQDFQEFVSYFKYIKPNSNSLICFNELGKDSFEYTFITKTHPNLIALDSTQNANIENINYNNTSILKTSIGDRSNYTFYADSIFINSSSQLLIENCIRSYKKAIVPDALKKVYATVDESKSATLLVTPKHTTPLLQHLFPNAKTSFIATLGEQMALDVDILQDELSFTGIITSNDSLSHAMSVFKNTTPREHKIAKVIPSFFEKYTSITFDAYAKFHPKTPNSLLDALEEVSSFSFNEGTFLGLRFISSSNEASNQLQNATEHSSARGVSIYKNEDATLFQKHFTPFIKTFNNEYYTILDEYIIFSSEAQLKNLALLIGLYKDEQTLAFQKNYKTTTDNLSDESSLLTFINTAKYKKPISEFVKKAYRKEILSINLDDYPFAALQFTSEKGSDYAHVHGLLKRNTAKASTNTVTQILNVVLDNAVLTNPQFVKNHITKRKEIVVQDQQHIVYLISTQGKILWKKQVDGKIMGRINQVDLYRNGRLQLAFTTPSSFYVLDRNGKDVKPYPIKAKKQYTQAVAIFDYDKNKNYRFLFTEGTQLKMRDKKANTVSGFTFSKAGSTVKSTPQHFRIGSKDYITIQDESGKLYILDRTGKTRIKVKEKISFSNNKMYVHTNMFTTSDSDGYLNQVDKKGNVTKTKLPVEGNHGISMTNKTLTSLSENKLHIKNKTVELDFGSYSKPELFLIKNKIYVTTTDLEAQKVYVYDSNAKLIPGFPAFGSSAIDLENFDKDPKLEFTAKGEDNTIVVYKMN